MAVEDIGKTTSAPQTAVAQYPQDQYGPGGYDPYALPYDPYMGKVSQNNWNAQMMLAVLDSKLSNNTDFDSYKEMVILAIDNLSRIPNVSMGTVRRLNRDFADICDLSSCQGTRRMVSSRMQKMLFEIRSLAACGETPLTGITAISSIITTRQQQEQTVKMPVQNEPRKKIFGVF